VRLKDWNGKVLFINIWASWCAPCVAEMESVDRLWNRVKDEQDLAFLTISEEDPAVVQEFLKKHPHSFPVYISLAPRPAAVASYHFPTTLVVSKSGRIV